MFYTLLQGRPKAPPATQNASQKCSEGDKNKEVRGTKFKIVATRCHILRLKCTNSISAGTPPQTRDPAGGDHSAPQTLQLDLRGPTSKGREGKDRSGEGREGKIREKGERKGREKGREGKEGKGEGCVELASWLLGDGRPCTFIILYTVV